MLQERESVYDESIIVKFDKIEDNGINVLIYTYTNSVNYPSYLSEVEDINMKAMGRCMYFGKSVPDNSCGKFGEILEYKLRWHEKRLVKVDRFFPSSKKCCKCGAVKKELKLSERIYICPCGNRMDRDLNAAINIREEARRMLCA